MDLYAKLIERGAQKSSAESTATKMLEEILAEEAGYLYEGGAEKACKIARAIENNISRCSKMVSDHSELLGKLERALNEGEKVFVSDETANAIGAYKGILQATQEVFGEENMTVEVMRAACEAGSYIAWRTIMGGKFPEEPQSKRF